METMTDPTPTVKIKLTADDFLLAEAADKRLERFLLGRAKVEELEAVAAIGDDPFELTTDAMISQIVEYRSNREKYKALGVIQGILAAVGFARIES